MKPLRGLARVFEENLSHVLQCDAAIEFQLEKRRKYCRKGETGKEEEIREEEIKEEKEKEGKEALVVLREQ